MMLYFMSKDFPRSVRKYIRKEKARIRRESVATGETEKKIQEFVSQLKSRYHIKNSNSIAS